MTVIQYPTDLARAWTASEAEAAIKRIQAQANARASNLDPSAGRFIQPSLRHDRVASGFVVSNNVFNAFNSSIYTEAGTHTYDTSSYGGAATADSASVVALLDSLTHIGAEQRRYMPSFKTLTVTAGAGTSLALDGQYGAVVTKSSSVGPTGLGTFGCMIKRVSGTLGVYRETSTMAGEHYLLDGTDITLADGTSPSTALTAITDTDWHFYTNTRRWFSFSGIWPGIYSTSGSVFNIAWPFVVSGEMQLDKMYGPLPVVAQ